MKGRTRTRRPRHLPFPFGRAAPYVQEGGMQHAIRRCPSPLAAPPWYVREGGTRGHAAPGPTLPYSRGREMREGMPPPLPVAPDTSPSRPVRAGWRHARAPLPAPHSSPFARKGGARRCAALSPRRPRHLPFPPRTREMEAREGTPPALPFPIRAEGGCTRACRPRPSLSLGPCQLVRAGWRHARAPPPAPHLPHSRGRGGCTRACRLLSPSPPAPPLLPWAAPPHTRGMGAREGTPPSPTLPHSRGSGVHEGTRPPSPSLPAPPPLATPPVRADMGHPSAHATPGFTLPLRAEGGCTRVQRPRPPRTRGHAHPGPPFPIHAEGGATKGGMRGQAAPSRDAPFAREWAHEAKPCRAASKTGAVSVRPRSPRPHPVCAA
ncbi:hypothetical protein EDB84DRAFT_1567811 [Lactarius hengduanensis]|nr:hypothetical protein EDB84DRAFT_1567811 [Lactarius hengduanensis]